jgi:hypothetical protein
MAADFARMEPIFTHDCARTRQDLDWTRREVALPAEEYPNQKRFASLRLEGLERTLIKNERIVQYAANMRRKYQRAAVHPWSSLARDPPVPER